MYSNFEFLNNQWPDIAQLGQLSETYLFSDSNSSMIKAGLIGEIIVQKIYDFEKIWFPISDKQFERIDELFSKDLIPNDVKDTLNFMRRFRNKASHDNYSSLEHAKQTLQAAYNVCVWFMEVYGDVNYVAVPYREPENVSTRNDYDEIIAAHEKKFEEIEALIEELKTQRSVENAVVGAAASSSQQENAEPNIEQERIKVYRTESIDALNLSVRSCNALHRAGINKVLQLLEMTGEQLFEIRNLGKKSVEEILRVQMRICFIDDAELESQSENDDRLFKEKEKQILVKYYTRRDLDIENIGLDLPLKNGLMKNGYRKFSEIVDISEQELFSCKSLGKGKIEKIIAARDTIIAPVVKKIELGLITLENADQPNDEDIDDMLLDHFLHSSLEQMTLVDIVSMISKKIEMSKLSASIGRLILKEKIVLNNNGTYELKLPSFIEVVQKVSNEKWKDVLLRRLAGETLEEIGNNYGNSRERMRQIEEKAIENVDAILFNEYGMTRFVEDRYASVAATYDISKDVWLNYIKVPEETYGYYKLRKLSGKEDIELAIGDETISKEVRERIRAYCDRNYIFIDGVRVKKSRADLEDFVVFKKCQNDTTLSDFFSIYNEFIEEIELENKEKYLIAPAEEHSRENKLERSNQVLWKFKKKFRYYDLRDKESFANLYDILALEDYHNIELSADKLFEMYPQLMKEYDIRDGYELHNVIRKTYDPEKVPELNIKESKTPMLRFGDINRDFAIMSLLFELAPISKTDFVDAISKEFGAKKNTIQGGWLTGIDSYFHDGYYRVDSIPMPPLQMDMFTRVLKEDFYYIDDLRDIYLKEVPGADKEHISAFNLKKMGFLTFKKYVIRNSKNAKDYFRKVLNAEDRFDLSEKNRKFKGIMDYVSALAELKHDYSIIEVEPSKMVSYRVLEEKGITKEALKKFCEDVFDFVADEYFTIYSLRKDGFEMPFAESGLSDWFYASILREDERFCYQRSIPQVLFRKTDKGVSRKAFINEIISEEGIIGLNSILDMLRNDYGMEVYKSDVDLAISDSEVYYDQVDEKLYSSYGIYKRSIFIRV